MYLSRLILNLRSQNVRRDLSDCQQLHRTIMSGFPQKNNDDNGARSEFGLLYRVETNPNEGKIILLVQSSEHPDWNLLPIDYLNKTYNGDNPACKSVQDIYSVLTPGTRLIFRLRANPTRKIDTRSGPNGERRNGRRVELRTDDAKIEWLKRKADLSGFKILSVRISQDVSSVNITNEGKIVGRRKDDENMLRQITFNSVLFDGELVITDQTLFSQALANGIGPAKAYGFGLLSIAPGGGH
jgi:CRISPR system Cascade subunit CasE